jgi:hypothetical protein
MALSAQGNGTNRVLFAIQYYLAFALGHKKHQTLQGDIFRVVP